VDGLLQMAKLLLNVMWTVASLLFTRVIITVDDRHPDEYHEHTDRQYFGSSVYIDDWTEHIDKHNYNCKGRPHCHVLRKIDLSYAVTRLAN